MLVVLFATIKHREIVHCVYGLHEQNVQLPLILMPQADARAPVLDDRASYLPFIHQITLLYFHFCPQKLILWMIEQEFMTIAW